MFLASCVQWKKVVSATVVMACGVTGITGFACAPPPPSSWASRHWPLTFDADPEGCIGIARWERGPLIVCSSRAVFAFDGQRYRQVDCDRPGGEAFARGCLTLGMEANRTVIYLPLRNGSLVVLDGKDTRTVQRPATTLGMTCEREDGGTPTSACWSPNTGFWMGHRDGSVSHYHAGQLTAVCGASADGASGGAYIVVDFRGRPWVAREGRLAVWTDAGFEDREELPPGEVLLAPSREGGIWVKVRNQLLYHDIRRNTCERRAERTIGTATQIAEDRQGRLWIATSRFGLHVWRNGTISAVNSDARWVKALHVDFEDTIWTGMPIGLVSFRDAVVSATGVSHAPLVSGLAQNAKGGMWFLTSDGDIGRYHAHELAGSASDHVEATVDRPGLPTGIGGAATSIASSSDHLWIGTRDGRLLHHASDTTTEVVLPAWAAGHPVKSLLVAEDSSVWVAIGDRLLRHRGGEWFPDTEHGFHFDGASGFAALLEYPPGVVWAATRTGQLLRLEANDANAAGNTVKVERLTLPGGLPAAAEVTSVCGADDGGLWIAVRASGLWRYRQGHWSHVDSRHHLPSTRLTAVVRDHGGRLWCGCDEGLFVADGAELEAVADGLSTRTHCWQFPSDPETNFLREIASPRAAALVADDGRVYFSLRSGLAIGNPAAIPDSATYPVGVQEICVADRPVADANPAVRGDEAFPSFVVLPPQPRDIRIDYGVCSFITPSNTAVFHQLVGVDSDWVPASATSSAWYSALPSGRHEFRLRSSDHRGMDEGRTVVVCEVPPAFWEYGWFRGAATLFVAGCGGLGVAGIQSLRSRYRMNRLRQQAAVDGERIRLARDMHDEVGTNLTQIALLAEVAKDDAATSQTERLDTIARISRDTVTALDELVWAVDPGNDTLPHLLSYACRYASEMLRGFGIACEVDAPAHLPPIATPGHFRRGVLLVVKEAVTNILAHARARNVTVRITIDQVFLRLSISDDGMGIQKGPMSGGAGLGNMRHRAAELRGECRIEPGFTGGTVVSLAVPLASSKPLDP